MKRKINIARITWVSMLFLGLIVILIAVMDYKIHYEYKNKNKIYFYDYDGTLSVTEVEDDSHLLYSKYECGYEECPVLKMEIDDTYVILESTDNNILYNYRKGEVISSSYDNYQYLNNTYFIVTKDNYQGIIDINDSVSVSLGYDQLGIVKDSYLTGYTLNSIIAKKKDLYGIVSIKDGNVIEEFTYKDEDLETLLDILNKREEFISN